MRKLRLLPLLFTVVPSAIVGCTIEKAAPDIGYGASDGCGATGASESTGGKPSGTGNSPGKGGKSNAGSGTVNEGGSDTVTYDECTRAWSEPVDTSSCDLDALEDSGETIGEVSGSYRVISKDTTLAGGKTYKLDGLTIIEPGATLTIEKCTKVYGQSDTSVLVTESGIKDEGNAVYKAEPAGRLVAVGEKNAPIVFTSFKPPGERRPGDWAGIVMCGKAPENNWRNVGAPSVSEGIAERAIEFGWQTDEYAEEDSGALEYVRIEYVGHDLGGNAETNGLTLNAVGSGTKLSHVMVSNAIDDCFEWFGGTVNADHLVAYNCDDDGFDTDLGFSGTVQFAFTRQYPTSLELDSNGLEWDNSKVNPGNKPITNPHFSNMTVCGGNTGDFLVNPRYGAVLRRGTLGSIQNTLLTGFDTAAFSVQDELSMPSMTYSNAFGNVAMYDSTARQDWFEPQDGNQTEAPAGMCDCYANPPQPFTSEPVEGIAPGEGFPEPDANFRGALKDSRPENNWMTGQWVDWSEN